MVGRAATAEKTKTKPKPRLGAKASAQVTIPKVKSIAVDAQGVDIPAAPKARRRVKVETCTRIYWAVFNQDCKRVAVFEFDQKSEAEKRAAKLITASGEHHFIQKIKAIVPV
jgi:hypothetical protein